MGRSTVDHRVCAPRQSKLFLMLPKRCIRPSEARHLRCSKRKGIVWLVTHTVARPSLPLAKTGPIQYPHNPVGWQSQSRPAAVNKLIGNEIDCQGGRGIPWPVYLVSAPPAKTNRVNVRFLPSAGRASALSLSVRVSTCLSATAIPGPRICRREHQSRRLRPGVGAPPISRLRSQDWP